MGGEGVVEDQQHQEDGAEEGDVGEYGVRGGHGEVMRRMRRIGCTRMG